jgi:hypothetical protein
VALVDRLRQVTSIPLPSSVHVAGGGLLHSPGILQQVCWKVDQCTFTTTFRVLQLSSLDAILGMDWLESHSPMQVHWLQKWLAIPYNGSVQILQRWFQGLQVPFKILQRRWSTGSNPTEQVLVQWSHLPIELATWEPLVQLQQQFPRAPVWGQPGSKEGGIVSSQTQPEEGGAAQGASEAQSQSAPRKTRDRKPNPHYVGPVWHN